MTEWLNSRTRPKLLALSLLMVTFAVGALSGAALNSAVSARELPVEKPPASAEAKPGEGSAHANGGGDRDREHRRRHSWLDFIGATEEQRARINAIFEEQRRQMDAVIKEQEPRMQQIISASNAEINKVLTPEQRDRLEERRAQMRERRAAEAANQQQPEKH